MSDCRTPLRLTAGLTAIATAGVLLAACGSAGPNQKVTYQYGSPGELTMARQSAGTYCAQYEASPVQTGMTGGGKAGTVSYECSPSPRAADKR